VCLSTLSSSIVIVISIYMIATDSNPIWLRKINLPGIIPLFLICSGAAFLNGFANLWMGKVKRIKSSCKIFGVACLWNVGVFLVSVSMNVFQIIGTEATCSFNPNCKNLLYLFLLGSILSSTTQFCFICLVVYRRIRCTYCRFFDITHSVGTRVHDPILTGL